MKKSLLLLLSLLLIFGFGPAIAHAYQIIQDEGGHIFEVDGVELAIMTASFPQIIELEDTEVMDRINHSIQDDMLLEGGYDKLCEVAYGDYIAKHTDFSEMTYEFDVTANAKLQTNRLITIFYTFSYYETGGAHPERWSAAAQYDLGSGEKVMLEQLVDDNAAFHTQVAQSLLHQIMGSELGKEGMLYNDYAETVGNWSMEQALLDSSGLLVFFNPYEIAPHAAGTLSYIIPYEEISDHFSTLGRDMLGE